MKIIGDATLYIGDSLRVMMQMPTESVDCILTDPPYSTGAAALSTGRKFIGVEMDKGYYGVACERLDNQHELALWK
ncbi:hypothetical protein [Oleidesulfovibrio sp.]|uniref:hypothetical protein n=1 Tax=Oleidesulfovibrio sp. TaxID=2909707 RepID=UPI003A853274